MRCESFVDILLNMRGQTRSGITCLGSHYRVLSYVTYNEIYLRSLAVAGDLVSREVPRGSWAILLQDNQIDYIVCFWACVLAGIHPVLVDLGEGSNIITNLHRVLRALPHGTIVIGDNIATVNTDDLSHLRVVPVSCWQERDIQIDKLFEHAEREAMFVQFTSGSTATPRGIVISGSNALCNCMAIQQRITANRQDRMMSWLPLTHCMGFSGLHMVASLVQAEQYLVDACVFLTNPAGFLRQLAQYRVTITALPNFALRYLFSTPIPNSMNKIDLSSIRLIFNGSEITTKPNIQLFIEYFKKYNLNSNVIYPVYGLSEATCAVSFPELETPISYCCVPMTINIGEPIFTAHNNCRNSLLIPCLGTPLNGVYVKILDDNSDDVGEGKLGYVVIRGTSIAASYISNGEVIPFPDQDGWVDSGDIGFIYKKSVYILGRTSEIIVHGRNIYLDDARDVASHWLMTRGVVSPCQLFSNYRNNTYEVILCIEGRENPVVLKNKLDLYRVVHEQTGIDIDFVVFVSTLPRTAMGKIRLYELHRLYCDGTLGKCIAIAETGAYDMPSSSTTADSLIKIYNDVLKRDASPNDSLLDKFQDSFDYIIFLNEVNERFGVNLSLAEGWKSESFMELAHVIEKAISHMT